MARRVTVVTVVVVTSGATDVGWPLDPVRRFGRDPANAEVIVAEPADPDIVVVDVAPGHGGVSPSGPGVRVVRSPGTPPGRARNAAAAANNTKYIAFLDADLRPDPSWLRLSVDALERDSSLACVGSRMVSPDGAPVGLVDPGLTFFGHSYDRRAVAVDTGYHEGPQDVLFPAAGAMVLRRSAFLAVGGFDERYEGVGDEIDLGWRLWLAGHRVRYEPTATVRSTGAGGSTVGDPARLAGLRERNALCTLYKNYDDDSLGRGFPAAMALAVRRGLTAGGGPTEAATATFAIDSFVDALAGLADDRRRVQATRVRSDQEVFRLFGDPLQPVGRDGRYLEGFQAVIDGFNIAGQFSSRRRIVVITADTLSARMAGPAIRAWHIALALSAEHDVQLVTTGSCSVEHPRFRCRAVTGRDLRELESWCDVLVFQGFVMATYPWLADSGKVMVVDIYDPFHLEGLEQAKDFGEEQRRAVFRSSVAALNDQLLRGDLFLCASDKQRDFWLGQLSALGRINPLTYDEDETLVSLVAVAPFGLSPSAPVHNRPVVKGVVDGIGIDDKLILWGGGIYNWFDPLTLIRAVDRVRKRRSEVRLFFLGLRHPNPEVPEMRMAIAARQLSDTLGLTDTHVFFNSDWVAYEDRQNYLLEADIGVSTHLDHVETAFSFRTRMLDYLWASLPIVATRGDTFADLVDREELGLTVDAGDVDGLSEAFERLLSDEQLAATCRKNVAAAAPRFSWSQTLRPLIDFCRAPRRAPDLLQPELLGLDVRARPIAPPPPPRQGLRGDLRLVRTHLREGGVSLLAQRIYSRARRVGRSAVGRGPI